MFYTFVKTREEILLQTVIDEIPHVVMALFIFYSLESKKVEARLIRRGESIEYLNINDFIELIYEQRGKKSMQEEWSSPNDVSFFPKKQKDIFGFFDENNINLLMFPIKNPEDGNRDLLNILYDRNRIDPQLRKNQKKINTTTKSYITQTLKLRVQSLLRDY